MYYAMYIRMINFDVQYFQLQLLELPVDHILDPLLLRDVPHRGPQLPSQLQEQEQAILRAAQVTTNIVKPCPQTLSPKTP